MRSAAQMISYELSISLCIICVLITSGSLNMREIVIAQQNNPLYMDLLMLPMFVVFSLPC